MLGKRTHRNGQVISKQILNVTPAQAASDQNDIASFDLAEATGPAVINLEGHLVDIEVAKGTAVNALSPTITISEGAVLSPASGIAQDFTSPVSYSVTAEDGTVQDWSVRVTEAALASFAYIEDFNTYGIGNLHEISGGAWSRENANNAAIPILNEGLSQHTTYSLDFSGGSQTHDFETLTNNPVALTAGQPFYFNSYFNVANLGANGGDRIRTAIRVDDAVNGDQWVRQQIAKGPGNTLLARIGLGASGSDQGNMEIVAGETIQFVVQGIWDGQNTITYSWTLDPKINLAETQWTAAGTHNVQGTPRLGRIFIGSNGINNGKLGPVRLASGYTQVVTEDNVVNVPAFPLMSLSPQRVVGDAIVNGNAPFTQEVTISNDGDAALTGIQMEITGDNATDFAVINIPNTIDAQQTATFQVVFNPLTVGPKYASLTVTATDVDAMSIKLNGLGKKGTGGDNEPSLQWVFDTQLGKDAIAVGDNNTATNKIDLPSGKTYNDLLGDELSIKRFERASSGEVTLEVLSAFGPENNDPVTAFGWYSSGDASAVNEIFTVGNTAGNGQRLNPEVDGSTSFDPGTATFGFYSKWPFFNNRMLFSEDALNTFDGAIPHHVRVYPMLMEENAYIIATEEHVSGFDYQDIVVIARNIKPAGVAIAGCNPISTFDCDALEVSLPYALSFTGDEGGLSNTGFTMVDNPSSRIAVDGAVSYPEVPGYEPGRISFSNGRMILNAANGLAFIKNGTGTGTRTDVNSQINILGVGIDAGAGGNFSLNTIIANPYSDTSLNFEQAGLWFGLNEDNYAKLVVLNGSSLQLLTEVDAVSDSNAQSVKIDAVNGVQTGNLSLRIYVDKDNDLLTAYYSINSGIEIKIGSLPLPNSLIQGNSAYSDLTFAGVMTSKRREINAAVNYAFESFKVIADDAPSADFDPVFINFSDVATAAPTGYSKDSGSPYADRGNGYTYGWLNSVCQKTRCFPFSVAKFWCGDVLFYSKKSYILERGEFLVGFGDFSRCFRQNWVYRT